MSAFMQERREYTRVKFRREVYLTFQDGKSLHSISEDFSMYGMGIITDSPVEMNQVLFLDFKILSRDDWRDINLRGKVVYSSSQGEQYKIGISFF